MIDQVDCNYMETINRHAEEYVAKNAIKLTIMSAERKPYGQATEVGSDFYLWITRISVEKTCALRDNNID